MRGTCLESLAQVMPMLPCYREIMAVVMGLIEGTILKGSMELPVLSDSYQLVSMLCYYMNFNLHSVLQYVLKHLRSMSFWNCYCPVMLLTQAISTLIWLREETMQTSVPRNSLSSSRMIRVNAIVLIAGAVFECVTTAHCCADPYH